MGGSPWATSNVMAKVAGITKTNTSGIPGEAGDGYCARLDTRMESVKVLGLVNITVLAAGSVFTGSVHEPIKGTKIHRKCCRPVFRLPKSRWLFSLTIK